MRRSGVVARYRSCQHTILSAATCQKVLAVTFVEPGAWAPFRNPRGAQWLERRARTTARHDAELAQVAAARILAHISVAHSMAMVACHSGAYRK
jgi:hypothetical protein